MKSKYCILLISIFWAHGCSETPLISVESTSENEQYPGVDRLLWLHFETFEPEAAKRGLTIDLANENILGSFSDLMGTHVAGQCTYNYNKPSHDRPTIL